MKTTYKLVLSLGVIFALGLTSCLKDDMVDSQKYGMINLNAKKIVEIPANSKRTQSFALPIVTGASAVNTTVHLAAEEVAAEDVKVTLNLAESATLLAAYNTANSTSYTLLPSSLYTLPNGLDVTIAKGSKDADFTLNVTTSSFDPSKTYAIFVKIAAVDKAGYTISGNFNYKLVIIAVKNKYDGVYTVTGTMADLNGTRIAKGYPKTVELRTTSATQVEVYDKYVLGKYGSYPLYIYTAADNADRYAFGLGFNFNSSDAITSVFDAMYWEDFQFTLGSGASNTYSSGVINVQWKTGANISSFPIGRFTFTETYTYKSPRP
jgi:hypothetical protein